MTHRGKALGILLFIVVWGIGLQVRAMPFTSEIRHDDEMAYLYGGLLLWEGEPPGIKHAGGASITWAGWCHAAAASTVKLLARGPERPTHPAKILPFVAIDEALFEIYRDLTTLRTLVLVGNIVLFGLAIAAGYRIGLSGAGLPAAVAVGGVISSLPLFLENGGYAKPYLVGWCLCVLSLWCLVCGKSRWRIVCAAVLWGLAVASRIDLLVFGLLLLWQAHDTGVRRGAWRSQWLVLGVAVITVLIVSPWLVTNLLGNSRAIVTVRLMGLHRSVWYQDLLSFSWHQGLAPLVAVCVAGCALRSRVEKSSRFALGILALVLLLLARGTDYGLRYQGATILTVIGLAPHALAGLRPRLGRWIWAAVALILVLPVVQATRWVEATRAASYADGSATWVESHVAAGSTVYLPSSLRVPLPTPASADALWREVAGVDAWKRKLGENLGRFGIRLSELPRALSEEHMTLERAYRRRWFILGGQSWREDPRYRIRLYGQVAAFDIRPAQAVREFKRAGGVLVWKGRPLAELGPPAASWAARDGSGTFVYRRPG